MFQVSCFCNEVWWIPTTTQPLWTLLFLPTPLTAGALCLKFSDPSLPTSIDAQWNQWKTLEGTPGWETGNTFGDILQSKKTRRFVHLLSFHRQPRQPFNSLLSSSLLSKTERSIEPSDWLGAGRSSWCSESCRKRSKRARCAKRRSLWDGGIPYVQHGFMG